MSKPKIIPQPTTELGQLLGTEDRGAHPAKVRELLQVAEMQADRGDLRLAADLCEALLGDDRIQAVLETRADALLGLDFSLVERGDARRSKAVCARATRSTGALQQRRAMAARLCSISVNRTSSASARVLNPARRSVGGSKYAGTSGGRTMACTGPLDGSSTIRARRTTRRRRACPRVSSTTVPDNVGARPTRLTSPTAGVMPSSR